MKKIAVTLFTALIAFAASAQNGDRIYKPFKFDIGIGPGFSQDKATNTGVSFAVEPKYAVMEQLSLGLRIEALVANHNFHLDSYGYDEVNQNTIATSSYLATADYYTSNKAVRPFVGCGLGIYSINNATYQVTDGFSNSYDVPIVVKFGGMIRAGFEVWHFRCAAEYNIVGSSNYVSPYVSEQLKNGYFAIKVGMFIGGRKIK